MKTRALTVIASVAVLIAIVVAGAIAADQAAKPDSVSLKEVKCPVSGKAVVATSTVEFDGGKVYFCCDNCPGAFKKDTPKFAAKAHMQEVQTKQLKEVACPFTGKPLNPEMMVDVGGVKVEFCCANCKAKVEKAKEDERVAALVFTDISKGFKPAKEAEKKAGATK